MEAPKEIRERKKPERIFVGSSGEKKKIDI
jgi:hypothetical protein